MSRVSNLFKNQNLWSSAGQKVGEELMFAWILEVNVSATTQCGLKYIVPVSLAGAGVALIGQP